MVNLREKMSMQSTQMKKRIGMGWLWLALLGFVLAGCAAHVSLGPKSDSTVSTGSFKVVGIGPGDGDLLTVRAVEAIRSADLVFCSPKTKEKITPHVDLAGKQVLDGYGVLFRYYGKDCAQLKPEEQTWHGKSCEQYHQKQAEFSRLVREAVAAGKQVVLLSSGDPTIYGPDMWSLKALHDLDPKVVPGLSAFNAPAQRPATPARDESPQPLPEPLGTGLRLGSRPTDVHHRFAAAHLQAEVSTRRDHL